MMVVFMWFQSSCCYRRNWCSCTDDVLQHQCDKYKDHINANPDFYVETQILYNLVTSYSSLCHRSRCCLKNSQPFNTAAMCLYKPRVVICGELSCSFTHMPSLLHILLLVVHFFKGSCHFKFPPMWTIFTSVFVLSLICCSQYWTHSMIPV